VGKRQEGEEGGVGLKDRKNTPVSHGKTRTINNCEKKSRGAKEEGGVDVAIREKSVPCDPLTTLLKTPIRGGGEGGRPFK